MKTCVKNTTLYSIAFLLFFFGNAVNAIHFCCDICRVQGTQVFTQNICHEQSEAEFSAENILETKSVNLETACDCNTLHSTFPFHISSGNPACSLERISINLDDFSQQIKLKPLLFSLFFVCFHPIDSFLTIKTVSAPTNYSSAVPLTGTQILHLICVLRN